MSNTIKKLKSIINKKQAKSIILLTVLLFFGMLLEILSLAVIVPLISSFSDENYIENSKLYKYFIENFKEISPILFFKFFLLLVVLIYVVKTLFLILLSIRQFTFLGKLSVNFNSKLLNGYLNQSYSHFINRNTNEFIKNIQIEIPNLMRYIFALVTLIIEISLTLAIVSTLFYIEPVGAISVGIFLSILSAIFFQLTKSRLSNWGNEREVLDKKLTKTLIEVLGGVKGLKVLNRERYFLNYYDQKNKEITRLNSLTSIVSGFPRFYLELISVIGMVVFIFILIFMNNDYSNILKTVGVFIAATFRLIPSINKILIGLQNIKFHNASLDVLVNEYEILRLQKEKQNHNPEKIKFKNSLKLNGLSFKYPKRDNYILKDINLLIKKGEMIGIIGGSGSGKSTLIDIILGLHKPLGGEIVLDGKKVKNLIENNWTKNIGYVPQRIFLIDDTIRNNIALGIHENDIDDLKIKHAIKASQLNEFIDSLPNGIDTNVGDKGIQISGGQNQRIAIARAIYNDSEILILDEATSSLDNLTEKEFIKSIEFFKNKKTIIIISHRSSSLVYCDKVFEMKEGKLLEKNFKS